MLSAERKSIKMSELSTWKAAERETSVVAWSAGAFISIVENRCRLFKLHPSFQNLVLDDAMGVPCGRVTHFAKLDEKRAIAVGEGGALFEVVAILPREFKREQIKEKVFRKVVPPSSGQTARAAMEETGRGLTMRSGFGGLDLRAQRALSGKFGLGL